MEETRTAAGKPARCRLAVQKVEAGWPQKAVADFLGVHPVTVNKWVRAHRADPDARLAGKPHPGRTPFLTPAQEEKVLGWLADKPTRHGFPTDLWTARRVADLIRQKFEIEFHPGYLREWVGERPGGADGRRPAVGGVGGRRRVGPVGRAAEQPADLGPQAAAGGVGRAEATAGRGIVTEGRAVTPDRQR